METIPTIYNYLYIRIKRKTNGIIYRNDLKEIIGRAIVKNAGIPRFMIKYVIEDLINLNLLEKINCNQYRLLDNPQEKRIRILCGI